MAEKLVLFDIDETLIDAGKAGTRALNRAFVELFQISDAFKKIRMAGMTDLQIVREGLRINGIQDVNGEVEMVTSRYLTLLAEEIQNPWRTVKPGVFEILDSLSAEPVPIGLLTGNLEQGAKIKLRPFGLDRYFPAGSFGSDHEDRNKLLPIAIEKFTRLGVITVPARCVVVGDTPRDVQCAKVHGARSIGVTTGPYDRASLAAAGADIVVPSLEDKEACLGFIRHF